MAFRQKDSLWISNEAFSIGVPGNLSLAVSLLVSITSTCGPREESNVSFWPSTTASLMDIEWSRLAGSVAVQVPPLLPAESPRATLPKLTVPSISFDVDRSVNRIKIFPSWHTPFHIPENAARASAVPEA